MSAKREVINMDESLHSSFNRRTLIRAATATAALLPLARASAQESTPESGEWTFTDDKGVTVTLPSRPERVVMDVNAAAPLWDFGITPAALFGWNVLADGSLGDAGGNIDPEGIPVVGDVNETIKLEELIAVEPDLIVTLTWLPDEPGEYWSLDGDANVDVSQVQAIAPIVAISAAGLADVNTRRFAELAQALGADLSSPELVEAELAFDAAIENFGGAAEASSHLSVLFMYPGVENTYIANPVDWADINMYQELGLNIVNPDVPEGEFWEVISNEQALKYPADVILSSTRTGVLTIEELMESPTWSQHPAVAAGQVFGWSQDFIMSYQGMTEDLIAAEPDLIITIATSLDNDPEEYWSIDASVLEQVRGVAPIVAITTTGAANEAGPRDAAMNTERFAELAEALGADLESEELVAARAEYEAATEHFAAAVAEKSDLTALFVATGEDVAWIAWEPAWDDLSLYSSMGLNIVELESHEGWWEQISQEQALRYPSDLFFISTRAAHTIEQLEESPSWGQHPAIQAGQAYLWNQDFIHSYQGMAEALNHIAESLEASEKVI